MTRQEMIARLRRLHTLLIIEKRSNNLALALRRAIDFIGTWNEDPDQVSAKISTRRLFAGYGPKFFRIYDEILKTGTCWMLSELQPRHNPFFCALCEIPSIGVVMAQRMYFDRSICTPEDLQIAYSNKILEKIPAFGDQRLKAIEEWLLNPPEAFLSPEDEPENSPNRDDGPAGAANERSRRNARIFQSAVFHAIGGDQIHATSQSPKRARMKPATGTTKAFQSRTATAAFKPGITPKRENCPNRGVSKDRDDCAEIRALAGTGNAPDAHKPVIPPASGSARELQSLSAYPERNPNETRRSKAPVSAIQATVSGRTEQQALNSRIIDKSRASGIATATHSDNPDIARDLQNHSICCSKFACDNLQANKIISRCIFAHTIQCEKLIAQTVTILSPGQWTERRQAILPENNDIWAAIQSDSVISNQIDALTIQADAITSDRIYCVRCACPSQCIDSKI